MIALVDGTNIKELAGGVNQRGLRNYNERLLLSVLLRFGPTAGSDLARRTGLSPQTVSIILRKLETDDIIMRGTPVKGRVGKPSVPMQLCPDGGFAIGMKIGRTSADVLLLDLCGGVREQQHITYDTPSPKPVFDLLRTATENFIETLDPKLQTRLCGIGIAAPYEIWNWFNQGNKGSPELEPWNNIDFVDEIATFSTLPVVVVNDATAGCRAEHLYGRGKEFDDYAYFFVGSFIGGGIVLGDSVYEGKQGNAGALGSLRSTGPKGESRQLVDVASLHLLEARLREVGIDPARLRETPEDWSAFARYVDPWLGQTAQELAKAALSACSVIDFESILIDGSFPTSVREDLANRTRRYLVNQDIRGLTTPRIETGAVGQNARAIGAAASPIFTQFFLDSKLGLANH